MQIISAQSYRSTVRAARSASNREQPNDLAGRRRRRRAVTLIEVMVTLTVISVLAMSSAVTAVRTVEQVHVDYAGASLQAVWNAQRLYWLEHRAYADDIAALRLEGVLLESLDSPRYEFRIAFADEQTFSAEAVRVGSGRWSGTLILDESGEMSGSVTNGSTVLVSGY